MYWNGIEGVYMPSNYISDEILDKVRQHYDIVETIGQYVSLKKSGRNYLGLCPFHSEKTPSFSVSPDKQIYHCFGCGAGGDVIRFLMDTEGYDFKEAVIQLANDAGILLPNLPNHIVSDPNEKERNKTYEIYDLASKLFHYLLLETDYGKNAFSYLTKRGFTRSIIEEFHVGFAPQSWDTLTSFFEKRDFSLEKVEQAGLIIKKEDGRYYDRFRDRIIFPITDLQGRVIAFGGRVLGDSLPKYLNSPETKIFNKSRILYNLGNAKKEIRKKRQAVLFEGYVDTISAYRAEIYNGVATLGTSLTIEQAKLLKRYCDEVIISYDSDAAGQQATLRAIDILQGEGCTTKIIQLPQGLDPDDYINKYGTEAFSQQIYHSTITSTAFKLYYIRKDYNFNDEKDRVIYLTKVLEIIADLQHAIEREHYLKNLAEEFQISYESLKNDLNQIYYQKRKKKEKTRDNLTYKWNNIINNGKHMESHNKLYPAYYNAEKYLVSLMLRDKIVAEKVEREIGSAFHVEDFAVLAAFIYSFYGEGHEADINKFMMTLTDKKYINLAAQLAFAEINEVISDDELNDYIVQVKKHSLELEIKQKKEEQLKAERNKDFTKSAEIGIEIIKLRHQLKDWK